MFDGPLMLQVNWTRDDTILLKGRKILLKGVKIKATVKLNVRPRKLIKQYQTKQHHVFQIFCL